MDRIAQYQEILHQILQEYQEMYADPTSSEIDAEIVQDDLHGQYLLQRVGWQGENRIRRTVFYLRLKQGKIWIEEDRTKDGIIADLRTAGIPENDIVLAFNPPAVRQALARQAA